MRASSTRRGTFPGRNPGTRTSRAIFLNAVSSARSNSRSSTSTESLTLLPSRGSTTAFMTAASVPAGCPEPDFRPADAPGGGPLLEAYIWRPMRSPTRVGTVGRGGTAPIWSDWPRGAGWSPRGRRPLQLWGDTRSSPWADDAAGLRPYGRSHDSYSGARPHQAVRRRDCGRRVELRRRSGTHHRLPRAERGRQDD